MKRTISEQVFCSKEALKVIKAAIKQSDIDLCGRSEKDIPESDPNHKKYSAL